MLKLHGCKRKQSRLLKVSRLHNCESRRRLFALRYKQKLLNKRLKQLAQAWRESDRSSWHKIWWLCNCKRKRVVFVRRKRRPLRLKLEERLTWYKKVLRKASLAQLPRVRSQKS
jgi:hypothetical protein